ncbi:MAG: hypothetical protein QXP36_07295 [Conexivisphaerales archaeon]
MTNSLKTPCRGWKPSGKMRVGNYEIDNDKMLELSNEDLARKIDEKKAKSLNNGHFQKIVFLKEIS